MIRTALVAAVVAALVAGGWGCTQSPGGLAAAKPHPHAARLAQLEAELATLKTVQAKQADDAATVAAALKVEREKAAGLAAEREALQVGLAERQSERDAARAEREAARAKLDGFRQELRELLGRVEGTPPSPSPSALGSAGF